MESPIFFVNLQAESRFIRKKHFLIYIDPYMAEKKRILIVTQEMSPYTRLSELSTIVNQYAQHLQESGMEVRILMPRFGTINERRHRLHEVVRLSGMNITVDDEDYPLIIKVASLPGTRMQVYFLDNEEFFKRKSIFTKESGELFDDNLDRTLFFGKGVIETVKKFGWAPHVVHCYGWMTSLLPALLKTQFNTEPIFQDTSIVYSSSSHEEIRNQFAKDFDQKIEENNLQEILPVYKRGNDLDLNQGAASFADALILGTPEWSPENIVCPVFNYQDQSEESFSQNYLNFYKELFLAEENA